MSDEVEVAWRPNQEDGLTVLRLIAELRDLYRPHKTAWTDLDAEGGKRLTTTWVRSLGRFKPEHVAYAIDLWRNSERGTFFPALNDLEEACARSQRAEGAERKQSSLAALSQPCDGSGWITRIVDEDALKSDAIPCGRCNPVLREVFNDRTKWREWLHGKQLWQLGVGVELKAGRMVSDRPMPEPCQREDRWDDNQAPLTAVDISDGRKLMEEARKVAARERAQEQAEAEDVEDYRKGDETDEEGR